MKLGIIIDSSSGLTKKQADKKGWGFIPLTLIIDEIEYKDGIDLSIKQYYEKLENSNSFMTATTSPFAVKKLFDKFAKEYDEVLVYPISSGLSSQYELCKMQSNNFNNVHVVKSLEILEGVVRLCELAEKMAETKSWEEINMFLNRNNNSQTAYLIPYTLDFLIKGGRIPPAVAKLATLLKVVPIILYQDGKLNKHGKGRIFSKTFIKILKSAKSDIAKFSGGEILTSIYHSEYSEIEDAKKVIKNIFDQDIKIKLLPPIIANHVGKEAIIIIFQNII